MPKDFPRTRRVSEQLQRELAELIRTEIRDPRVGMVSVSGVEVSKDLNHAKVFVSVLGEAGEAESAVAALNHAAGFLRGELGRRMVIRVVPHLRFIHDHSLEDGARLSALIDAAVSEDEAKHRDEDE
jgi:ribosome-binding factor A